VLASPPVAAALACVDVLACPRCGGALGEGEDAWRCAGCQTSFPTLSGIPVLFREPARAVAEWRRQIGVYQALLGRGVETMSEQLKAFDLLPATRQRLEALRGATVENGERVMGLLRTAGLTPAAPAEGTAEPDASFSFIEYYDHILRDWGWDQDSDENVCARDLVLAALGEDRTLGRVAVLGAGGCRLAYDLHQRCKPALTVALDISPLFLLAAKRIMFGTGLQLYEFPASPRDLAATAVERDLRAPGGTPQGLHLVLGDAFASPLRAGAFDTVITPWFIDIVPVDIRETLGLIHGLLAEGGRWINHGPLSYAKQRPHGQRYTVEELATLVERAGFAAGPMRAEEVELLRSGAAANSRRVRVMTFVARKTAPPSGGEPPSWLLFPHVPIPRFPGLDRFIPEHPVLAFIAGAIDGTATLGDIAGRMIKEHGARPDAALAGTRALLTMVYQQARR
jgi:uncharacterized protein YbaR (Trm112 family)